MTMPLTIVARIVPTPGKEDDLEAAMKALVAATRAEAGCIQYDLHRTNEDPCVFLFFENWETHALWRAHMDGPHLKAFNEKASGMIDKAEILQMTRIA